ncbi:MAG: hypothetical protein EBV58_03050 [Actinobacteria bacterium]|nr:hypothetical protein [Actinomycetota bacterium]
MANKQPEPFVNSSLLPLGPDKTIYRKISSDGVTTEKTNLGTFLRVEKSAITTLTEHAMRDIAHLLRTEHLQQLAEILKDPQASANDRFVALDLLKNASISAGGVLPMCQDTGTAIVKASKGQFVFTGGGDEEAIAKGIYNTYQTSNLRYSQLAPITMFEEVNTNTNLPAEIKISATDGDEFKFLFIAKGGGSANKSYLFQETKALLNEKVLLPWLFDKMQTLGTSACPPYHLAVVIGGTSAEYAVETAKLASTKYLIDLTRPMSEIRATLSKYPVKTRVMLSGPMIVARDIAHAKLKERLDSGKGLPDYFKQFCVYYAGPAKTPTGFASGSFGPTTAGRMDSYVDEFQRVGGSLVMLAKGNRSTQVTQACKTYGGFYLGSIGGPAARLAQDCITKVEVLEYEELGMEAVWKIEVKNFPAFIVVDDKGNDFFEIVNTTALGTPVQIRK